MPVCYGCTKVLTSRAVPALLSDDNGDCQTAIVSSGAVELQKKNNYTSCPVCVTSPAYSLVLSLFTPTQNLDTCHLRIAWFLSCGISEDIICSLDFS
jgi:hypothetical protein